MKKIKENNPQPSTSVDETPNDEPKTEVKEEVKQENKVNEVKTETTGLEHKKTETTTGNTESTDSSEFPF